jgi:cytidine deaminase
MKHTEEELIAEAEKARQNAYAPYSNFKVGAAVETDDGDIYIGCNVESASYGLTVCAERVAIWKGISRGVTKFGRIAVVVDTEEPTPPCGTCRQIIWEFCGDVPVILANLHGKRETVMMSELLPRAFDSKFLK